jgi:Spy/CpxP family protein refolding chaperone
MSIQQIRTSILVATGVGVIAAAGLVAGRLSAGAFPQHVRGDVATRTFGRISRALDLTDDQKTKVKDVLRSHADEIKAQMVASSAARRGLHDAVMAQPIDESSIRAAAQRVGQAQGDAALLLARIRAEVDPILTTDQKAKIQQFQERMHQHGQAATQSFDNFLRNGS